MLSYKMQDGQTIWEFLNQKPDEADVLRNSKISTHIYFLLVTCTVPYVFIFDVIPESGHSETQQYWLNVFVLIIFIEVMANWLCCQFVSTHVKGTRDRPVIEKDLWAHEQHQDYTKDPNYCSKCKLVAPYGSKTHHCKQCNKCILRRDHHCFMVGTCIGYYNQRYFVMLTFYIGLASILGFHYSRQRVLSLSDLRSDFHWTEHLLPLTIKHFFFGRISLLELVLMFYCYTFAWTTIMGTGFFCVQMLIIFLGKTFHEFKKEKRTRSYRTVSENFMEVFGPCWVANFILPMQLVFRQKEFDQPFLPNKRHSTVLENGVNGHSQEQSDHVVISM